MKRYFVNFFLLLFIICGWMNSGAQAATNTDLLFVPIGDAIMKAKAGDFIAVEENMAAFDLEWKTLQGDSAAVEEAVQNVNKALAKQNKADVQEALTSLSTSLVAYDEKLNPVDQAAERKKVAVLLPKMEEMKKSVIDEEAYKLLEKQWTAVEKIVRAESTIAYGDIETKMALLRISIVKEPNHPDDIRNALASLQTSVQQFLDGQTTGEAITDYSLADYAALLKEAEDAARKGDATLAAAKLTESLSVWPVVEGAIQVKEASLYSDIEVRIPEAAGILSSANGDAEKAADIIADLYDRVILLTGTSSYTWWDAALVLLREGLEAVVIISALVAFLAKTGQTAAKKWIWIGAAGGVGASIVMALILNYLFSGLSGASGREYMEGFAGIAAVVMMIGVGMWMHGKSNMKKWTRFVDQSMGKAAASGSIVSFAVISFLSVFREGAETIIFYAGMAPNMSVSALVTGIVSAIIVVSTAGFLVMKYSVKIPLRPFFISAAMFIYVLAFKILGKSIHSLQVAGAIDTHQASYVPFIDMIGLYPTIETVVPQIVLLILIAAMAIWIKKQESLT